MHSMRTSVFFTNKSIPFALVAKLRVDEGVWMAVISLPQGQNDNSVIVSFRNSAISLELGYRPVTHSTCPMLVDFGPRVFESSFCVIKY